MEWAYANGYGKKYASAGWASYERHFIKWATAAGFEVDIVSQYDLQLRPEVIAITSGRSCRSYCDTISTSKPAAVAHLMKCLS